MNNLGNEVIEWIKTIAISLVIALIITSFVKPTLVKGYSMYPTLEENDYLIIDRLPYKWTMPSKGDIVVFKSHFKEDKGKEKDLVKRVIGVEKDKIRIENGKVYINDEMLNEEYINGDVTDGYVDITIPDGYMFVMGDNRPNSLDSRDSRVGLVNCDNIIGKVFLRLYPFDKMGTVK